MRLKPRRDLRLYLLAFIAGLLGAFVVLSLSNVFKPKTLIASVNVNKIVSEYINKNKTTNQDEMQLAIKSKQFMSALEKTMHDYSVKNNVLLVVSEAIITGAEDVTSIIRREMEEELNG